MVQGVRCASGWGQFVSPPWMHPILPSHRWWCRGDASGGRWRWVPLPAAVSVSLSRGWRWEPELRPSALEDGKRQRHVHSMAGRGRRRRLNTENVTSWSQPELQTAIRPSCSFQHTVVVPQSILHFILCGCYSLDTSGCIMSQSELAKTC